MLRTKVILSLSLAFSASSSHAMADVSQVVAIQQARISSLEKNLESQKKQIQAQQAATNAGVFSWSSNTPANGASLIAVFNTMRDTFAPGIYTCIARTSSLAHWKGYGFDLALNYYNRSSDWPHMLKNIREINAGTTGCTGSFSISTNGTYTLVPGNCFESVNMVCKFAL